MPTDTVYGIGADPFVPGATAGVFQAKRRPEGVLLPVLVDSVAQAEQVAVVDERAQLLIDRFWPGGLTVVMRRHPGVSLELGEDADTVAVRCPDHAVPRQLCAAVGPLAVTSANLHGEPTPQTAGGVAALFGAAVAVVVDGGRCEGAPSTVVDCTKTQVTLRREGRVPWSAVQEVVG